LLQKNPAHYHALEESLAAFNKPTAYDEIFLHVFAPVIVSFVEWVLDEAVKSGKRRLYFLARDGWLMYQVAQILGKGKKIPELRYLKVSRYSLRMAEYGLLGEKCLDTICVGGIDISFRKLMMRASFTEQEIIETARITGYETKMDTPLNYVQIQELKEKLRNKKKFFEYVNHHSKKCYDDTIGYLRQEGLLDNVSMAVVDSGWIGTIQQSLEHLIHVAGNSTAVDKRKETANKKMEGYYFGIYEIPKGCNAERYHGYYIHPKKDILRKTRFCICLFETLFSSPEGMTMGYERTERSKMGEVDYIPLESIRQNPNEKIMYRNKELLCSYLKYYVQVSGKAKANLQIIERLLKLSMGNPTRSEAEFMGALQFCDDVLELQMQSVAAKWDEDELKKQKFVNKILIKLNIRKGTLHESGWPEGSIVNAGHRRAIRQEHFYKYFMYIRKDFK